MSFVRRIVNIAERKTVEPILNEYRDIQKPTPEFRHFLRTQNASKNCHPNILLYDHNRVILNSERERTRKSDYIHASYVDGYKHPRAYILTQGPSRNTVDDLWMMILEQDVKIVVLLGETRGKGGTVFMNDFWPLVGEELRFCDEMICLKTLRMSMGASFDTYQIAMKIRYRGEERKVLLLQFTEWKTDDDIPHSLPTFIAAVRAYENLLYNTVDSGSSSGMNEYSTVVICSTGAIRSGTFVTYDICTRRMLAEKTTNLCETVRHIRWQRYGSVQFIGHYLWLTEALVNFSMQIGIQPQPARGKGFLDIGAFSGNVNRKLKEVKTL